MPTKCCWVIYDRLTSERKASTSPSSFINRSTLLLDRALKRQAPCLHMRALDRLRRQNASTRRRGNHMHDHLRFQRDIDDVTGVSLSLSLSRSLYYSQKSLTHNIGSASALPMIYTCNTHCNDESKYPQRCHPTPTSSAVDKDCLMTLTDVTNMDTRTRIVTTQM